MQSVILKNKNSDRKVKWPEVSFILLTYNGGEGVRKILESIKIQDYPKDLVDVVVVDDGSTDNSVDIAKQYNTRIFKRKGGGLYANWVYGLHRTKGDYVYYVEQDIELRGEKWIKTMLTPLLENKDIIASFTREGVPRKDQHWINRFISYHPAQCDPIYEFLTPSIESTYYKKKKGYILCKYQIGHIPPSCRMFYRKSLLKKTPNWQAKNYFDHDFMTQNVKSGFNIFAYVPDLGIYHHHARNFRHLLQKRARNLHMHYFPYNKETEYKWLNVGNRSEVVRMIGWIIYANLFFPALFRGIYRYWKFKDRALLMEPIVVIAITDLLIYQFLTNEVGRNMAKNAVRSLLQVR